MLRGGHNKPHAPMVMMMMVMIDGRSALWAVENRVTSEVTISFQRLDPNEPSSTRDPESQRVLPPQKFSYSSS
jgi:hypothetical protein